MGNGNPGDEFLDEVRRRLRQGMEGSEKDDMGSRAADTLLRLREATRVARIRGSAVGSLPPQPDTLRARLSMLLVRMVRQALFWYTPQIVEYQSAASEALETQIVLFETICRRLDRADARAAALQLELNRLTARD